MDILYLVAVVVVLFAQFGVQNKYQQYRRVESLRGMRGCDVARMILDMNGCSDVIVQPSQGGTLSDHYNPVNMTVNLSPEVYYKSSIASISIAAHEVGHAIQHAQGYPAIALRNRLLPFANIASSMGWTVLIIGLLANIEVLFYMGIVSLIIILLFQVVTLPIEFDASKRALYHLSSMNIITVNELGDCRSMLNAAAMTYVASVIATLAQIMRFVLMNNRRRR